MHTDHSHPHNFGLVSKKRSTDVLSTTSLQLSFTINCLW